MKLALIIATVLGRRSGGRDVEFGSEKRPRNEEEARANAEADEVALGRLRSTDSTYATNGDEESSPGLYARFRARLSQMKNFIMQNDGDEGSDAEHSASYRWLPIFSGIVIPFSILLEVPGLTEHWYIVTENNKTVLTRKNSPLLEVGLSISMACALIANIAIIIRFLEKKVRTSTLIAIGALTIHDIINIVAVTIFGVIHRFNDGFTYGDSFWFIVCSTGASFFTNITLIVDYVRTPDFAWSSSGLTRKQRSLVIVVMILLCWIAFGALINSILIELTFIEGLYFTIVAIETIGFGDIYPTTTGARIFCAFHSTMGILNLALAVGICNDTIIESFEHTYKKHLAVLAERRKERRIHKAELRAKQAALRKQLERAGKPVYAGTHHVGGSRGRMRRAHLNVEALTPQQKADAVREALEVCAEPNQKLERRSTLLSVESTLDTVFNQDLQKDIAVKLSIVWTLFLTFWLIGAAIFMATEGWSYGIAMWFCFESFSTIGFGDRTPVTPAGRSVFIVWALLGVGTMTILISVLSEAYSSRYQKALQTKVIQPARKVAKKTVNMLEEEEKIHEPYRPHVVPRRFLRRHASWPHLPQYYKNVSSEDTTDIGSPVSSYSVDARELAKHYNAPPRTPQ